MQSKPEKTLAQKLQIKADRSAIVLGAPKEFVLDLPAGATKAKGVGTADVVLFFANSRAHLERELPKLRPQLKPTTIVWLAWRKGNAKVSADLNRDSLAKLADEHGLTPNANIAISAEWSALRLKII